MAVHRIRSAWIEEYIGEEGDTKPTLNVSGAGSTFHEFDTGDKYVWSGTDWELDLTLLRALTLLFGE